MTCWRPTLTPPAVIASAISREETSMDDLGLEVGAALAEAGGED